MRPRHADNSNPDFKKPKCVLANAPLSPLSGAGSASFPFTLTNMRERSAGRRGNESHALRPACEARRGEACTHLAMRPPPGAPPRHLQASRSMGVAPSTPGRVSGNRHWRQPVQRAPRRAPVSGARAGSGAAPVRVYETRPEEAASHPAEMTSHDNALG